MTDLITEARELYNDWMAYESMVHGGGKGAKSDDGEANRKFMLWLVDEFPTLCDALEQANAEIERMKNKYIIGIDLAQGKDCTGYAHPPAPPAAK